MTSRSSRSKPDIAYSNLEDISSNKRKRFRTSRYEFEFLDNEEQRLLQQALKISKLEQRRMDVEVPEAPVYYPTLEEFHDSMSYISKIRPEAEKYGICKIVPPKEWKCPNQVPKSNSHKFPTKLQPIHTLQQGQGFDDGKNYTVQDYREMAERVSKEWADKYYGGKLPSYEALEKDYWEIVETNQREALAEYGNDLDSTKFFSGFPRCNIEQRKTITNINDPDYYAHSTWNLNNMPSAPGSILRFLKAQITGINVPWLYFGMLFSTFCWHNEDNYFASINYSHHGHGKQWYGVPGSEAEKFEKVSKEYLLGVFRESPDILHHMTMQIPPRLMMNNGVHVYKTTQEAGTFVITFPKSYHGGFSYGYNIGEAVNFATIDWLPFGTEAEERYRHFARGSVFSHQRLLMTILENLKDYDGNKKILGEEVQRILDEEYYARKHIVNSGIRDISSIVKLPKNTFYTIDDKAVDYDDMRCCTICKNACIFSAVACECDKSKVACSRHFHAMCKCPKEKKFLLAWTPSLTLKEYINHAKTLQGVTDST